MSALRSKSDRYISHLLQKVNYIMFNIRIVKKSLSYNTIMYLINNSLVNLKKKENDNFYALRFLLYFIH